MLTVEVSTNTPPGAPESTRRIRAAAIATTVTSTIVYTKMNINGDPNRRDSHPLPATGATALGQGHSRSGRSAHRAAARRASAQPAGKRSFIAVLLSLDRHPVHGTATPGHNEKKRPDGCPPIDQSAQRTSPPYGKRASSTSRPGCRCQASQPQRSTASARPRRGTARDSAGAASPGPLPAVTVPTIHTTRPSQPDTPHLRARRNRWP